MSFVVSTDVMHEILAVLALHSFAIVQSSSFFFVSGGKIDFKNSKNVQVFPKNCSLEESYSLKKHSVIYIHEFLGDTIKFYFW